MSLIPSARVRARGRYEWFLDGASCGEEHFEILPVRGGGAVATIEQSWRAPHPLAGEQRVRAELSAEGRMSSLELDWLVGTRALHAHHRAEGATWHVRIDYAGHVREQQGDYPPTCEVLFGSPLSTMFALHHFALAAGAEHEFAALVVGPPYMAVEPGKQRVSWRGEGVLGMPWGSVAARQLEWTDAAGVELPTTVWVDAEDRVLELRDGLGESAPLMARMQELVIG